MSFDGLFNEWTPEERDAKEAAIVAAPRRYAQVIKGPVDGELEIVDIDFQTAESDFAFCLDALNFLLSHLKFPNKLKPFLDSICGAAAACGSEEFSATNLEIGQRSRSGRDACSDGSMEKWVSRQKKKLDEWMRWKGFEIVKMIDGEYNFETKRRMPTRYQIKFNFYVVLTVVRAKSFYYWRGKKGKDLRRFQGRAIREAARQIIKEIPEAPPLRPFIDKSLTKREKINRRHTLIMSLLEKQRDDFASENIEHLNYFILVTKESDKICLNPTGLTGKILTPDAHEPSKSISIYDYVKSGEVINLIAEADRAIDEQIQNLSVSIDQQDTFSDNAKPLKINDSTNRTFLSGWSKKETQPSGQFRHWRNGGWVEHSNKMPEADDDG